MVQLVLGLEDAARAIGRCVTDINNASGEGWPAAESGNLRLVSLAIDQYEQVEIVFAGL